MGFRLPLDGWEATFYGLFEHLGYMESGLSPETTGVLDARGRREWGDGWRVGGALEYYFLKQVFDASEIEGVRLVIPTEGHTLAFRPGIGREHAGGWRWEVEAELSRQWLREPLDGFLDAGVKGQVVWKVGGGSEVGVSYRYRERGFDERLRRDEIGLPVAGRLRYEQHEGEGFWRVDWDEARRWRTTVRAGYLGSMDNGGGFFDYDRWHVGLQVRYVGERWEARADGKARWYRYPVQTTVLEGGDRRRRNDLTLTLRADWKLGGGWRVFGQYEFEMADENMEASDYRATGVSAGVEFEM